MGKAFDSIARGLNEAISHAKGAKIAMKTYTPEEVVFLHCVAVWE